MNTHKLQTLLSTLSGSQKVEFYKKLEQHIEQSQNEINSTSAYIVSTIPLSDQQKSTLEKEIVKRNPRVDKFNYSQNPALIGGLKINIADQVYDYSLARYL